MGYMVLCADDSHSGSPTCLGHVGGRQVDGQDVGGQEDLRGRQAGQLALVPVCLAHAFL